MVQHMINALTLSPHSPTLLPPTGQSPYVGQQHSEFYQALLDFSSMPHFRDVDAIHNWMEGPLLDSLWPIGAFG